MAPVQNVGFPHLKSITRLGEDLGTRSIFDLKFYPYSSPGVDPIFALSGGRHTIICRPLSERDKSVEVIRCFEDDDDVEPQLNSIAWTHAEDGDTAEPLVCVSGGKYTVKVLNVITGGLVKTLVGHGGPVTDLTASPVDPCMLASASEDHTIRLWNLRQKFDHDPCRIVCAGEGHKAGVLTIAWHQTGKFLLSGGFDTRINLWILPTITDLDERTDKAKVIHLPHFSTIEVHSDYVDCISFYNDLIISKSAKENRILLWKITGFSAQNAAHATPSHAPTSRGQFETRSAFSDCTSPGSGGGFQVLMTFDTPGTDPFWMRFGLFHAPRKHPVLAMGHHAVSADQGKKLLSRGHISFWDLQLLEDGLVGDARLGDTRHGGGSTVSHRGKARARGRSTHPHTQRPVGAIGSSGAAGFVGEDRSVGSSTPSVASTPLAEGKEKEMQNKLRGPFHALPPHKIIEEPGVGNGSRLFTPRAVAWSVGGEWCVAAGEEGTIWISRRWEGEGEGTSVAEAV